MICWVGNVNSHVVRECMVPCIKWHVQCTYAVSSSLRALEGWGAFNLKVKEWSHFGLLTYKIFLATFNQFKFIKLNDKIFLPTKSDKLHCDILWPWNPLNQKQAKKYCLIQRVSEEIAQTALLNRSWPRKIKIQESSSSTFLDLPGTALLRKKTTLFLTF